MKHSPTIRAALLLLAVTSSTVVMPTITRAGTEPTPPTTIADIQFDPPVFLIHVKGHGTTAGDVTDDFIAIYNQEPDAMGNFLTADGSGGTIGWGSDFHSGPYSTATAETSVGVAMPNRIPITMITGITNGSTAPALARSNSAVVARGADIMSTRRDNR